MVTIRRGSETIEAEIPLTDDVALVEGVNVVDPVEPAVPPVIPYPEARDQGYLVLDDTAEAVRLAMREGADPLHLLELRRRLGRPLALERVDAAQFEKLLGESYSFDSGASSVIGDMGIAGDGLDPLTLGLPTAEDLLDSADDAPAIRLINGLIAEGLRQGVSDIHIEPYEAALVVRMRIDGVLQEKLRMPPHVAPVLVSRIKVMARLDIAERRVPQDGRIGLSLGGKLVDVRVSTLPSRAGERVVLRLLDKENAGLDLAHLGLDPATEKLLRRALADPNGIILVTGPTGSGKTTTLYSTLKMLATEEVNVCTIEDPIEMVEGAFNQMQVQHGIDLGFADGVRALMRQDPDIIMIGEVRDLETAEMAVQAALTGHLVFSTVHTNDAPSAITRLLELGVPAYLLNATVIGIMAQRLVRTLCPHCRAVGKIEPETWAALIAPFKTELPRELYQPVGCIECRMTGYRGRTGIYEILEITPAIKALVSGAPSIDAVRQRGLRDGMRPLRVSGAMKVVSGVTTVAEVLKATPTIDT